MHAVMQVDLYNQHTALCDYRVFRLGADVSHFGVTVAASQNHS